MQPACPVCQKQKKYPDGSGDDFLEVRQTYQNNWQVELMPLVPRGYKRALEGTNSYSRLEPNGRCKYSSVIKELTQKTLYQFRTLSHISSDQEMFYSP